MCKPDLAGLPPTAKPCVDPGGPIPEPLGVARVHLAHADDEPRAESEQQDVGEHVHRQRQRPSIVQI